MSNKRHKRIGPHVAPCGRFTGPSGSDSKKRKKSTKKQRRKNRGTHINKYSNTS
jgi:hypothetical protein